MLMLKGTEVSIAYVNSHESHMNAWICINATKGENSPGSKGADTVFSGLGFHLFLKSSNVIPQMVGSDIAIC